MKINFFSHKPKAQSIKVKIDMREDLSSFAGDQFKALMKRRLTIPVKSYHL